MGSSASSRNLHHRIVVYSLLSLLVMTLVLPLIPYGVSYHHDDFSGTISISNSACRAVE